MKLSTRLVLVILACCLGSVWAAAQATYQGQVTSAEDGEVLIGATILVEGTSTGTATDLQGNFEITASPGQTLLFSYTGFQQQKLVLTNETTVNVALSPDNLILDEVVKTGYREQLRSTFTGSASTVETETLERTPLPTLQEGLQGNVTGLFTTQGSGQPGAFQQVFIRGLGSINAGTQPLYVVDGIPVFAGGLGNEATTSNVLAGLNPSDIASINVLKDASAASIWGSRAANGVIIITTKSGQAGKPKVSASVQTGISDVTLSDRNRPPNTAEYLELLREGLINDGRVETQEEAQEFLEDRVMTDVDTDWFDEISRQGTQTQGNVSISGGDDNTKYYLSGGAFTQEGVVIGTDFERLSGKLGLDTRMNDWLKFDLDLNVNQQEINTVPSGGAFANPVRAIYRFVPVQPVFNEDGSYNLAINSGFNVVGEAALNKRQTKILNIIGGLGAQVKLPIDGLSYEPSINLNRIVNNDETWENPFFGSGAGGNGEAESDYSELIDLLVRNQLVYSTFINDTHGIDLTVGYESQQRDTRNTQTQVSNFAFPNLITLDNGSQPDFINGGKSRNTLESMFFNASYNYRGLFFVNGTARRDGSSRFGSDNRYGNFWSIGASVNLHRFAFLQNDPIFSAVRVRASYGVNGNQEIGNFASRSLYSTGSDYNGQPGIILSQLGLSTLTWEENKPLNVGFDLGMWNRLNLKVDFYRRTTSSLLFDVPVSRTNAVASITDNIGELENRGVEIELNTRNFVNPGNGFNWTTNFNISFNTNEVTALPEGDFNDGSYRRQVGSDWNTWYMRGYAGVDVQTGDPLWYTDETETETTTNFSDAEEYANHGKATPDFVGGLTNTFTYKGFSLSAQVNFVWGNTIYHSWHRFTHTDGARGLSTTGNLARSIYERRWQQPGDVTDTPRFVYLNRSNSNEQSSRFLYDGSYIRLRNVEFSYSLPQSLVSRAGLSNVRVFARGANLLTHIEDDRLERDPQVDFSGFLDQEIPVTRTYTFGLNLSF